MVIITLIAEKLPLKSLDRIVRELNVIATAREMEKDSEYIKKLQRFDMERFND